jgi:hypothetical protein
VSEHPHFEVSEGMMTDARVKDHNAFLAAQKMAEEAKTAETGRCIQGEPVFYMEYDVPLVPGHIYSDMGRKEFRLSGLCEYHFDMFFAEEDHASRRVMGGKPKWMDE